MSTPPDTQTVRFAQADLELFRDASGDRNPLHLSPDYASKTAYGQQVVFGALGALACLGRLGRTNGLTITKLTADFHRPMFLGVTYGIRFSEQGGARTARLQDGTVPVLTLSVQYGKGPDITERSGGSARFGRMEASEHNFGDLPAGTEIVGLWAADGSKLSEVCQQWSIDESDRPAAEALLWSSYAVGMEVPGKSALFFRVALEFTPNAIYDGAIAYSLKVTGANKTISQIKVNAELRRGTQPFAHGQIVAFVRPEVPPMN
ncbi:MAG: MaoC/PaaZ C-terminal domain-containing protein, partial [Bryobacteraceae bacterium]